MMAVALRWLVLILAVYASATYGKGGGGGGHSSGGGHASVAKSAPAPARVAPPTTRPYIGWFPFFGNTGSTEEQRKKKEATK
jgi:hypothetical protein